MGKALSRNAGPHKSSFNYVYLDLVARHVVCARVCGNVCVHVKFRIYLGPDKEGIKA